MCKCYVCFCKSDMMFYIWRPLIPCPNFMFWEKLSYIILIFNLETMNNWVVSHAYVIIWMTIFLFLNDFIPKPRRQIMILLHVYAKRSSSFKESKVLPICRDYFEFNPSRYAHISCFLFGLWLSSSCFAFKWYFLSSYQVKQRGKNGY